MPFLLANDSIEIIVPAGQKICVTSYGAGTAKIETATEPGNYPIAFSLLTSITNSDYTSSAFTRDTTVKITAGLCDAEYVIGVSPVATKDRFQPAAVAITGGSINGTTIGQATPSSGSFTNLIASGNVGIGVTPSAWGAAYKALQLGFGCSLSSTTSVPLLALGNNSYYNGSNHIYKGSGIAQLYVQDNGGNHLWFIAPSGTAGNAITFTQAMTLDAGGNLGIGVTPSAWSSATGTQALQIGAGGVSILGVGAGWSGTQFMYLSNNAYHSSGAWRYLRSVESAQYVQNGAAHQWFIAPSGTAGNAISFTQAMTLTNNGNLLVGGQADSGNRACFFYATNSGPAGLKLTSATRATADDNVSAIEIIGNSNYGRIFNVQCDGQIEISPLGIARFKINNDGIVFDSQPTPDAVNATATLTTTNLSKKIITSTTAAAVTATLPTGTLMDGAFGAVSDLAFNWTVINTGPNAFTLAVGTGHTIVGNAGVATNASGTFRSRRTGAAAWVSYRIS